MYEAQSALSELRELGLTVDINEVAALKIMANLLIIDGTFRQKPRMSSESYYGGGTDDQCLYAAYHAIAKEIVQAGTPDDVLQDVIPTMVYRFRLRRGWLPTMELDTLSRALGGPISEWQGKRLLMTAGAASPPLTPSAVNTPDRETIAEQLTRLREESRMTFEELAEKVRVNPRTVQRHIAGDSIPYSRHIAAYERVFSRLLDRKVLIKKMP
jgi:DNA-binding transcriptional ArsR family regulator